MATKKREKSTNPRGHYVTNAELLPLIARDKAAGNILSNELAKKLYMIAERFSYSASFINYSFREDMVAFATVNLVANWHKFDLERDNPFSFYTTAVYHSFLHYLGHEKNQRNIRDKLLVEAGANPSYSFQEQSRSGTSSDDHAFRGSDGGGDY